MKRLLITGSRNWPNAQAVWDAIDTRLKAWGVPTVIVHGHCPTGADMWADNYRGRPGCFYDIERHPADWDQYGKHAGPMRNQLMVALGADLCLAFPLPDSRGTFDCMGRARAAGIPVTVIELGQPS